MDPYPLTLPKAANYVRMASNLAVRVDDADDDFYNGCDVDLDDIPSRGRDYYGPLCRTPEVPQQTESRHLRQAELRV